MAMNLGKTDVGDIAWCVSQAPVGTSLAGILQIDQELPSEDAENRRITSSDQDN